MFNSISGTITAKLPASIFIDNHGIEWDISVPSLSLDSFGPVGSAARVFIWLCHREDQMRLYGFASTRERDLFNDLMKVEGVGPKQAIKILSSIRTSDLEAALDAGDVTRLQSAPGIGTKTAQKMILALKGKLTYASDAGKGKGAQKTEHEDVVAALAGMGFDRKAAIEAVESIFADLAASGAGRTPGEAEKELFRRAIVALSSGQ